MWFFLGIFFKCFLFSPVMYERVTGKFMIGLNFYFLIPFLNRKKNGLHFTQTRDTLKYKEKRSFTRETTILVIEMANTLKKEVQKKNKRFAIQIKGYTIEQIDKCIKLASCIFLKIDSKILYSISFGRLFDILEFLFLCQFAHFFLFFVGHAECNFQHD